MAGNDLGLSPAVASAHIGKLEDSLGTSLIHRTTRKISLTDDGEIFLPLAENIIASAEAAKAAIGSGSYTPHGTLRICAPASFARMYIIKGLEGFMCQYPQLKIELKLSDNIIDMVEGGFDIAIRDAELNDSSFKARKLAKDDRKILASPKYLASHGTPNNPDELAGHCCINLFGLETWHFDLPDGLKTIKTNTVLRVDNGEAVRDACAAGLGLAISSTWCSYKEIASGELIEVLADFPLQRKTDIWAVYPNSQFISPKVRVFIDYFSEYFGDKLCWEVD